MWELFQKIQKYNITPNQCMLLFAFNEGITPSTYNKEDHQTLIDAGYLDSKSNSITPESIKIITTLNNYFVVNKKKLIKNY